MSDRRPGIYFRGLLPYTWHEVTQLNLNIRPRLVYSAQNFIVHDGVREIISRLAHRPLPHRFELFFAAGPQRCGKTHLSLKIADIVSSQGGYPRLADGANFPAWLSEHAAQRLSDDDVLIVDDAHAYLSSLRPGMSGPFVDLIERARTARSRIMLLSEESSESFSFDEHVASRLAAGAALRVGAPSENEMRLLIDALARQRGLSLTERKISYLLRRIPRSVPSVEEYLDKLHYLSQALGKAIRFPLLSDAI
jgi:chromosomal replication initiation ATPase DnaA